MCGIAGKLAFGPPTGSAAHWQATLTAMVEALRHRGPDDHAMHVTAAEDWTVGLGHARLSIIDLSPAGRQPMANEDGTVWLVCNGEIYNYVALRRDLADRGHRFTSRSDSEVILHGYEEWGLGVLDRLEGMFAFAVWDQAQRRLVCARDPAGVKPLYWQGGPGEFRFASEIKAVLADPTAERVLEHRGLAHYLAYGHGVAPVTALRGIYKLPPGHWLVADSRAVTVRPYWDLPPAGAEIATPAAAAAAETRDRLTAAVRSHMVADVPVGAFLSGGLDSSAVVALMSRLASGPVETYTAGFAEEHYDERVAAARVARHFSARHTEVLVTPADFRSSLGLLAWQYDEPFADAAAVPLFLLARAAARRVKVVLTGEGSDELFAGYRRVSVERFAGQYGKVPGALRRLAAGAASRLPRLRKVKQALTALAVDDPAERYASWLTVFDREMRHRLLADAATAAVDVLEPYRMHVDAALDPVTRALRCDFKTWLPDTYLEKVDKATMACGLEARVPFLDRQLIEYAFTLPPGVKIAGLDTKHVLKKALTGVLPDEIIRRRKSGFAVPLDPWFRGPLRDLVQDVLTDSRTRQRGLLQPEYLTELAGEHWQGRHIRHAHLYQVIMLELWCRSYLDGPPGPLTV